MKYLKIIGLTIVVVIGLFAVIGFFLPREVNVVRAGEVSAPADSVFALVNDFKKWDQWSVWHKIDPNMKVTYSEKYAGEGASYSWTSENDSVGNGTMTILKSEPSKYIKAALVLEDNGLGEAEYLFEPTPTGTLVTMKMQSDMGNNPFARYFGLVFDDMIGPDFEKCIENLNTVLAKNK